MIKISKCFFLMLSFALCLLFSACQTGANQRQPDFSVNLNSQNIQVGEVEMLVDPVMGIGKLRNRMIIVSFYPRENAVRLHIKKDLFNYYQFWSKTGRLFFINALRLYNEDFNEKKLDRNDRKSKKKYGTVRGFLIWQQARFMTQARGNSSVDFGYTFKDGAPYFTVSQHNVRFTDNSSSAEYRESGVMNLFFTRAQAAKLAEIFEEYTVIEKTFEGEILIDREEIYETEDPQESDVPKDDY